VLPACRVLQVHAEQFLMANMVQHNEPSLVSLAISAAPCGHCRQFYSELACAVSDTTRPLL
jgi:cytidine deaminase